MKIIGDKGNTVTATMHRDLWSMSCDCVHKWVHAEVSKCIVCEDEYNELPSDFMWDTDVKTAWFNYKNLANSNTDAIAGTTVNIIQSMGWHDDTFSIPVGEFDYLFVDVRRKGGVDYITRRSIDVDKGITRCEWRYNLEGLLSKQNEEKVRLAKVAVVTA